MSLSQSFFPSENEEIQHPQFTKALKGFNVDEVDSYVFQTRRRIEVLEEHLDRALEDRDHLRHELASVKSDVYRSAGERLAGILRSIDDHVEGIRRQAEEDANRRIVEAERLAGTLKKEAEEDGARTRADAARVLQEANEESERVLGALVGRRDELKAEIESLRGLLQSLLERLGVPPEPESPAVAISEENEAEDEADWAAEIDEAVVDLRDITVDEES
jgi:cell division septum initiation protein DivIVA